MFLPRLCALRLQTALDSAGGAGQRLVDRDGFPRADIDVHTYLQQSQGLSRASNDHKTLLENAAQALHRVHEGLAECKRRGLRLPPPEPAAQTAVQVKQQQRRSRPMSPRFLINILKRNFPVLGKLFTFVFVLNVCV